MAITFKTADLFIEDDLLKIKTIFGTREKALADCKRIGAVLFVGYYVEFHDGKKTYVMFSPDEIFRSNDKIREIRNIIDEKLKYLQK